jgi:L-iditol 2-dehydrogenase
MRAAFVPAGSGHVEVGDFDMPSIGDGQVLVRMNYASICGSDLHVVYHGFFQERLLGVPGYPGHEGVGEVVESKGSDFKPGDRVLTVPLGGSGQTFADYMATEPEHLIHLPDGDLRHLLMAQQLGTTVFAMKSFWPHASVEGQGRTAVVLGAGSAGLFFLQQVKLLGFDKIVVSDLNARRLSIAQSLGASVVVQAPEGSVSEAVADLTNGVGADLVIEAAGFDSLRTEAVEMVVNHGVVGCFGFPETRGLAPYPSQTAFRKSAAIVWCSNAQIEPGLSSFREAVRLIDKGIVDVKYCAELTMDLEEIPDAFELAERQADGEVKIAIELHPTDDLWLAT